MGIYNMDMYGYILVYVDIYCYIYIYIYSFLEGFSSFLSSGSVIVALHLPTLEFSALTPPIVDYLFGTGLRGMFLLTMGSFYVFGERWDLTCFYNSDPTLLRKHRFPC